MSFKHWIADNIGYRYFGCCYNLVFSKYQDVLFDFTESKIPEEFLRRKICDLGCGDGSNTLRIKKIFKPKNIVGYDNNDYLLKRARKKGLEVKKMDLNHEMAKGEMATFTYAIHHLNDKEKVLKQAVKSFKYVFLCEPIRDLFQVLFDTGKTLPRDEWIILFDKVLKRYQLYQHKNNLIVFYTS